MKDGNYKVKQLLIKVNKEKYLVWNCLIKTYSMRFLKAKPPFDELPVWLMTAWASSQESSDEIQIKMLINVK